MEVGAVWEAHWHKYNENFDTLFSFPDLLADT